MMVDDEIEDTVVLSEGVVDIASDGDSSPIVVAQVASAMKKNPW